MDIPFRKSSDGVTIQVRVEPRSSHARIAGVVGDTLKVKLTAPPADGAANKQLVELLSKELGVRKSDVSIIKGRASKNKLVALSGVKEI